MTPADFHGKCCADTRYRHTILQKKKRKEKPVGKYKGNYVHDRSLFCSDCESLSLFLATHLVPGTRYYNLYSLCFRRPPQQLILTKNFHYDANK